MKLLHLFKEVEFANIQGYDDIKFLVRRALDSDENYNLLFCGPPASSKTLFLVNASVFFMLDSLAMKSTGL